MAQALGAHAALFKAQAALYAQFRPTYPAALYASIEAFAALQQHELALDVATGTGQVAAVLAQTFKKVLACDSSQSQLAHAVQRPNIVYQLAPAERLPHVAAGSVDLATAAQCLHWFDIPAFYREMRRVLKPSGTLAVWGYGQAWLANPAAERQYSEAALAEANRCLRQLDTGLLGPYWDAKRQLVESSYGGLEPGPADFCTVQRLELSMHRDVSLAAVAGYISSWSSYTTYRQQHPEREDPLLPFQQQLREALQLAGGDGSSSGAAEGSSSGGGVDGEGPAELVRLEWPLFLILAKDPVPLHP